MSERIEGPSDGGIYSSIMRSNSPLSKESNMWHEIHCDKLIYMYRYLSDIGINVSKITCDEKTMTVEISRGENRESLIAGIDDDPDRIIKAIARSWAWMSKASFPASEVMNKG